VTSFSTFVHVVELNTVDLDNMVLEPIEVAFVAAPLIRVPPISTELFQITQVRPILPRLAWNFVRPTDPRQPLLQMSRTLSRSEIENGLGAFPFHPAGPCLFMVPPTLEEHHRGYPISFRSTSYLGAYISWT
jgi:hypothetical protein